MITHTSSQLPVSVIDHRSMAMAAWAPGPMSRRIVPRARILSWERVCLDHVICVLLSCDQLLLVKMLRQLARRVPGLARSAGELLNSVMRVHLEQIKTGKSYARSFLLCSWNDSVLLSIYKAWKIDPWLKHSCVYVVSVKRFDHEGCKQLMKAFMVETFSLHRLHSGVERNPVYSL